MAFGDSGILDSFTRANSASLGANWGEDIYAGGGSGLSISSNAVTADGGFDDGWWSAASFNAGQEVFFTVTTIPNTSGSAYVFARLQSPGTSGVDGYNLIVSRTGTSTWTWTINRVDNGTDTVLSGTGSTQALANGDAIGLRISGSTLGAWYRASGGSWTELFTRTDSTYSSGGYIGFGLGDSYAVGDDFGGGNINDATATIEQEGFRWRNDDGSETGATWAANQDTNITADVSAARRLRLLLNATGAPASSAFRLDHRPASGSWVTVPVSATASATWGANGTAASGTTSCSPAYPTGISAATSKLFCIVTGRSNTADTLPTMPSGWTRLGGIEGGTGTWGTADNGTRMVHIFQKDVTDGTETGSVTVSLSGTSNNTLRANIFRVEVPSNYNIDVALSTATDTSRDTSLSFTGGTSLSWAASDLLIVGIGQDVDTATHSSQAISASGATFTRTNRASTAVTNGNDHRHIIESASVDTGSGSSAPTFSATTSANASGAALFARMRAVPPPFLVVLSSNITAGGEATTAQLTAPSGKSTSDFVTGRMWDNENGTDTIDITTDDYTEVEWCVQPSSAAVNGTTYEFRVTVGGTALATYTVTPSWTIGQLFNAVASSTGSATVAVTTTAPTYEAAASSTASATVAVVGSLGSDQFDAVASSTASATVAVVASVNYAPVASSTASATVAVTTTGPTYAPVASSSASATVAVTGSVVISAVSATDAGYALRFYGYTSNAENRVRIELDNPSDPPIDVGAGDFTYEWWMRCAYADNTTSSIPDARYSNIVLDRDIWGHPRGWVVGVTRRSGPILAMCFAAADTGGGWTTTYGTTDVGDNAWHHIAFTWRQSTSTLELYVDGTSQGTRTLSVTDLSYPNGERPGDGANNEYLVIGGEKHGVENFAESAAFTGYVDEFRVSDTRRYTAAFTRPSRRFLSDGDTVALFRFDEGTGTTTTDASGLAGAENGALLVGGSPNAPAWATSDAPITELNAEVAVTTTAPVYSAAASRTASATVSVVGVVAYAPVASSTASATVAVTTTAPTYGAVASSTGSATVAVTTTAPTYSAAASSTASATVAVSGGVGDTFSAEASSTGSATVAVTTTAPTYGAAASSSASATVAVTTTAPAYAAAASSSASATVSVTTTTPVYGAAASSSASATVAVATTAPTYSASASSAASATVAVSGGVGDTFNAEASSTASATVAVTTTTPTYSASASSTADATVAVTVSGTTIDAAASSTASVAVAVLGETIYDAIASETGSATVAITVAAILYAAIASSSASATVTVAPDGITLQYSEWTPVERDQNWTPRAGRNTWTARSGRGDWTPRRRTTDG